MEDRAIRGIRWTLLAFASTRGANLLTTVVLARLLVPADFGTVAFAALIVAALTQVGTLGLAPTLVARPGLDRTQLSTALGLLLALNAGVAALVAAAAVPLEELIGRPADAGVLAAMAAPALLGGVNQFFGVTLQRELEFAKQFAAQASQVAAVALVAISLAAAGAGVWSLVAGQAAGMLTGACLLVAFAPYRLRPRIDRAAARFLLREGRGFLLQGTSSFVEQNADYLAVGAASGARPLGLYVMAYRVGELPYDALTAPVAQATFPGFARMRERSEDVVPTFLGLLRYSAVCALPFGVLASGTAAPLVAAVFGNAWTGSVELLAVLGIWGAARTLQGTIGWFVNSVGLSWHIGRAYTLLLVPSLPAVAVAAVAGGPEAVAWVMLANVAATGAIVATIAHRHAGVPARGQWAAARPAILAAVPTWLAARGVADALAAAAPGVALLASAAAGAVVYVIVVTLLDREVIGDVRRQLGRALTRAPSPA